MRTSLISGVTLIAVLALNSFPVYAITIAGNVFDTHEGNPLAGAIVGFYNNSFSTATQEDGSFTLNTDITTGTKDLSRRTKAAPTLHVKGNHIELYINKPNSRVSVEVFTIQGRMIGKVHSGTLNRGMHQFTLPIRSDQVLFIKIGINGKRWVVKVLAHVKYCQSSIPQSFPLQSLQSAASRDEIDILMVIKKGYSSSSIPCSLKDTNGIKVVLKPDQSGPSWLSVISQESARNISPHISDSDFSDFMADNRAFAMDMYQQLRQDSGNVFFSPYSIATALAMSYAGARNQTAEEMKKTLRFPLDDALTHTAFNRLDLSLTAADSTEPRLTLAVANQNWGQAGFYFLPSFLDILTENYGAGFNIMDFIAEPESCRITINSWVSDQTNQKINDLIPAGKITPLTRLVLTNAIYFFADWHFPFDTSFTVEGKFQCLDSTIVNVPMMAFCNDNSTVKLSYKHASCFQAVELPYAGERLVMDIFLPHPGQFSTFEDIWCDDTLTATINTLEVKKIKFSLPRFSFITPSISLKEDFQDLGMVLAFSQSADFSGITGIRDLYISDIFHKGFISVNEEGTEAAAATAVIFSTWGGVPDIPCFFADRPFVFVIRDTKTGAILFMGRVVNPL